MGRKHMKNPNVTYICIFQQANTPLVVPIAFCNHYSDCMEQGELAGFNLQVEFWQETRSCEK